jgi:hypothetical protein
LSSKNSSIFSPFPVLFLFPISCSKPLIRIIT